MFVFFVFKCAIKNEKRILTVIIRCCNIRYKKQHKDTSNRFIVFTVSDRKTKNEKRLLRHSFFVFRPGICFVDVLNDHT